MKKSGGAWLGVACAVLIAFAWGRSTGPSTNAAASPAPISTQDTDNLEASAPPVADATYSSSTDSSDATPDADDDQYATSEDSDASDADADACDEGSYISSNGDCVHGPVAAATAPEDATAQCNDGTYSFSEHRQGTCSHHGGVAEWL
jgi:hypothetical protein